MYTVGNIFFYEAEQSPSIKDGQEASIKCSNDDFILMFQGTFSSHYLSFLSSQEPLDNI